MSRLERCRGNALVIGLVVTVVMFGIVGSIVVLSRTDARALSEARDRAVAFYLAEAGLAAAKEELFRDEDSASDGIGNVTVQTPLGTFTVQATDLGDDRYGLAATGTAAGDLTVNLAETVELAGGSRFPSGAISVAGSPNKVELKFKKHNQLSINGGKSAALAFDTASVQQEFLEDFSTAIDKKELNPNALKGDLSVEYQGKDLSIYHDPHANIPLQNVEEVFEGLSTAFDDVRALATQHSSFDPKKTKHDFGSADNPVILEFDKKTELKSRNHIVGHGTLIITDEFKIDEKASLTWDGDIIVYSHKGKKGKVHVEGGLNLTGSLFVLGERLDDGNQDNTVELKVASKAQAAVTGNVFLATSYNEDKGKKAKLEIDGRFELDGLMTLLGSKVEVKFKDDSDLRLQGSMQIGFVDNKKDELKMEFDGKVDIRQDDAMVDMAAALLHQIGFKYNTSAMGMLTERQLRTVAWSGTPEAQSAGHFGGGVSTDGQGNP